jgi:rRNA maturation RNase YbeY
MAKISFNYIDARLSVKNKNTIKAFIPILFEKEKKQLHSLHYIFCSDEHLLEMNKQYLNHDYYTDIITFDLTEAGNGITGEVYISVDRIKDNAIKLNQPFETEVLRVIFHGALHLCGYKDKKKAEQQTMRNMEDKYIQQFYKTSN